ncbi:MAG: MFS transporter [Chloroflexota bacterium]
MKPATPDKTQPGFFYGYIIVLAAFVIMTISFGTLFSFGVFFKPMLDEFGWSRAFTSGAFSLCVVVYGFTGIISGRLSDRYGPRLIMTVSGLFLGAGYLLMSRVGAAWQLYLIYGLVIGIGMSGSWAPMVSLVARWFVKYRGLTTGLVASGSGLGVLIVPIVVERLIAHYDWRQAYFMLGLAAQGLFVLAAQFLKRDPAQLGLKPYGAGAVAAAGPRPGAADFSLEQASRTRQFWTLCFMYFCFAFALHTIMVHIVPHALGIGFSPGQAASILAAIGWLNFVSRIIMGSLTDRIGGKPSFIIGFILLSGGLIWLLWARQLWMLYLFAAVFGFAYGNLATIQSLVAAELFGLTALGAIVGSFAFSYTLGGAAGPFTAGAVFDATGSYQVAFVVCIVLSLVGLVLACRMRPPAPIPGGHLLGRR